MKKILLAIVIMFAGVSVSLAQSVQVTGKITYAADGLPIIGASVIVKGTTIGDSADIDGNYSISIPASVANKVLEVSYIGMTTQEKAVVSNNQVINFALEVDSQALEEVVIVGYGTQRKESLTGALDSVSAEDLKTVTSSSVENMLNGKVSGVYVAPGSGQPGTVGAIVIRGKSTINGSTAPLWVIDGVIVGSSAGSLNPEDIETITVLKDAASTAIYGSQGSNGVILVTTKRAKAGETVVNLSAKIGTTTLDRGNLSMMSGSELYDYYASFDNQEMIVFSRWNSDLRDSDFDWWDLATTTGFVQDYNASISTGTEKSRSFFSVGLYDESGAVKGYDYTKYSARFRNEYTPVKWLTIKPSVFGSITNVYDAQYSVSAMYSMLPWDSPYNDDGSIREHYSSEWVNSNSTNYLYDLQYNYGESVSRSLTGSLDFDVTINDKLSFSSVNSYRWGGYYQSYYYDPSSSSAEGVDGRISIWGSDYVRLYTNQLLRYSNTWDDVHRLDAIAGYEFNSYDYYSYGATGTGFTSGFDVLDVTTIPEAVSGTTSAWAIQSFLSKFNYSYDNRIVAEASIRRDGASEFGANARYGTFFSVSLGWNIDRESWFNVDAIDALKTRISYGSTGNRPSSLYAQYDLYSISTSASYNGESGALISQVGNPDMTWETTYTTDFGLDMTAFDGRLRFTLDLYDKATTDLLYAVPVSGITGVTSIWQNVGEVNNRGIEVSVGGDIIRTKDWTWGADFNIGHNRNKVVELYDGCEQMIVSDGSGIAGSASILLQAGLSADTWYMKEWAGVDSETGAATWYKTADDGSRQVTTSYAEADQVALGEFTPDVYGSLSTYVAYKNWSFNAIFGYSIGGSIYNYARTEYDSDGAYTDRNQMNLMDGWSRWENPGDDATHPVASYNNTTSSNSASSRFLEDGSYLKLRTLSLGYNVPMNTSLINSLRVSLTGENLFTITNYSGVDPEVPASSGSIIGTSITPYPSTRKFMLGLDLIF